MGDETVQMTGTPLAFQNYLTGGYLCSWSQACACGERETSCRSLVFGGARKPRQEGLALERCPLSLRF